MAVTKPHKATHTKTDTIMVDEAVLSSWKNPPFQRGLRVNDKVRALAETIKQDSAVIPGVITLGVLGRDTYLLDGQHRAQAFRLSGLEQGYADIRIHVFEDMAAMGQEFVNLNSRLVNLKPDDVLRGLEESLPALRSIRSRCSMVGYDMVRRNAERAPFVSMSTLLRAWQGSSRETPGAVSIGAMQLATDLTMEDADNIAAVMGILENAWGRNLEYIRLWNGLNLTMCLWLYRRMVIARYSTKTPHLTKEMFCKAMMGVSANGLYLDWLVGRKMSDRDRSPAMSKLRAIVARRIEKETGKRPNMPSPAWLKGHERKEA